MNLPEIKSLYKAHLEKEDGSAMIGVSVLKFLVAEAEKVKELQFELQQANTRIHELDAFKHHAEFLLGERQYEYLENETQMHLLREKADV